MKKKAVKFIALLLFTALLCSVLTSSVSVEAAAVVPAEKYKRNKTLWCWATAAVLQAEHYQTRTQCSISVPFNLDERFTDTGGISANAGTDSSGYRTASARQRQGVLAAKGSDANHTGNNVDIFKAIHRLIGSGGTNRFYGSTSGLTQSEINWAISDANYFSPFALSYPKNNSTTTGHTIIIESYAAGVFYVKDTTNGITKGFTATQLFNDFSLGENENYAVRFVGYVN